MCMCVQLPPDVPMYVSVRALYFDAVRVCWFVIALPICAMTFNEP